MRGLKTLILRLTISTILHPFEIYSFDNRTKYWECCEPKRNQVTRRNIRMEMENMEDFTYDGNYTDGNYTELYSLQDNVSNSNCVTVNISNVGRSSKFSITIIYYSLNHCQMNFRLASSSFSPCFTGPSLSRRFSGTPRSSSS